MPPTTTKIVPFYPGLRIVAEFDNIPRTVSHCEYWNGKRRWKIRVGRGSPVFANLFRCYRTIHGFEVTF